MDGNNLPNLNWLQKQRKCMQQYQLNSPWRVHTRGASNAEEQARFSAGSPESCFFYSTQHHASVSRFIMLGLHTHAVEKPSVRLRFE